MNCSILLINKFFKLETNMSVNVSQSNISNQNDKIDMLMNKLSLLEEAFKEERRIRIACEEELKTLKKITLTNLQKQLEEKESLLKTTFIDKIKLEKQLLEKSKNTSPSLSILNNEDNSIQTNKLEYYQNAYKDLRKKYSELLDEKSKLEQSYSSKFELEKEKNSIILKDSENIEKKLQKNNNDLKMLSESNKNLLVEVRSVNNILDEVSKHKEVISIELQFYKNELELK